MATLQKRTVKGIDYWCLVESKRINGKPRPVIIEYFGNTQNFVKKLMNDNLDNNILKSYSHGDTAALWSIAKKLQIESILDSILSNKKSHNLKRSTSLILIAIQRVCKSGSKNEFSEWANTTTLPFELDIKADKLTSQHFWEQMDGITNKELDEAESRITKKILELYNFELEKIALDYTNYFTYIDSTNTKSTIAKRGRNKQKRNDLRQYSLALITTKEMGLPLCSYIYEGNKNDQTTFSTYVNLLKEKIPNYNPLQITLVFDGGSNNKKNLNELETHYICSFSLSSCKELYEIDLLDYIETTINDKVIKYYRTSREIWGKERECILTFSKDLLTGQLNELNNNIQKASSELTALNEKLHNNKSRIDKTEQKILKRIETVLNKSYLKDIFDIKLENDLTVKNLDFAIKINKKDEIIHKYFGKKLLITDRHEWSSFEILKSYREQDCIEKIFRDTKDAEHFSIRPQYHYTDQKIRVHIFCCLLGLTFATILQKELINHGINLSKGKMLDTLHNIRQCWIKEKNGNKVKKKFEEMNELESNLWSVVSQL